MTLEIGIILNEFCMIIGNIRKLSLINVSGKLRTMRFMKMILLLKVLLMGFNVVAWECNEQSIPIAYLHNDLIFVGKVYDIYEEVPGEFYARFQVSKTYKGIELDSVNVFLGGMSHSYSQAVPLGAKWMNPRNEVGKTYLIYAYEYDKGDKSIFLSDMCGRTIRVTEKTKNKFDKEVNSLNELIGNKDFSTLWFDAKDLYKSEKPHPLYNLDSLLGVSHFEFDSNDVGLSIIQIVLTKDGKVISCKVHRGQSISLEQKYGLPLIVTLDDQKPRDEFEAFVLNMSHKLKNWFPARSNGNNLNSILLLQWYWDDNDNKISCNIL